MYLVKQCGVGSLRGLHIGMHLRALALLRREPVVDPGVFAHMAVARQQQHGGLRVLAQHMRHPHVPRHLRQSHAAQSRFGDHAAVALENRLALDCIDLGRHAGIQTKGLAHWRVQGGVQPIAHNQARILRRYIRGQQRNALAQGEIDNRFIKIPIPTLATGSFDHTRRVRARLLRSAQGHLLLAVELLHRDHRLGSAADNVRNLFQPQGVALRVVVDFAEQVDRGFGGGGQGQTQTGAGCAERAPSPH